MLSVYKFDDTKGGVKPQAKIEPGVWINVTAPSKDELSTLEKKTRVPEDFLLYGLDPDEGARYEYDADVNVHLLIFDMPVATLDPKKRVTYKTIPLAIIITATALITIDTQTQPLLSLFAENRVPDFDPRRQNHAALQMMYRATAAYLTYLRDINKARESLEAKLQSSLRNEELYGLMGIQRGLVYFMMSLRTDRNVLQQLERTDPLQLDEEGTDLLDDILIENQQGIEMAQISNSIISETTDTYSNIINNNMNGVMKFLTSYSIILTIPTLVFSFYGMNMDLPWAGMHISWIITIIISLIISVLIGLQFWKNRYF
ncbi:magnesium transporter CorA family protein [Lacticaseibacillus camelliae]|uniref:MIT family metal ion transporter CorA n=1 Tax=Lacticaseibacillus camelliae DSM 22697 = JCM 13995 TaxID=1423730 RepID=A0A0R2EZX8_9LACO|nr:magnesium transporter CorA family protein [Lacticaseibacillus camelliae]KRN20747.1 MIT family metal ion transporter CorA [Lacticaseibacillus camelliae DSM 22697 = JCM 13995]